MNWHRLKNHLQTLVVLLVMGVVASCGNVSQGDKRSLVVTIEPLGFFVDKIAGDQWQVASIVPAGFSPEEFTPSASEMTDIAEAECLFKVGSLGFETTWLKDAVGTADGLRVCDTSVGIDSFQTDPHTWTSPANARVICRNISQTLTNIDPANAEAYSDRLQKTLGMIDSLDQALDSVMSELPSRSFVIAHPALTRFAADYNLQQIAIEENGKEPTPASIQRLVLQAKAQQVAVVFIQQEFPEHTALVIAKETGARIVAINPLAYDWPNELVRIAKALKSGKTESSAH